MVNTRDPARSVFRLSWDSDALWLREYTRRVLGDGEDGLVCFRVRRRPRSAAPATLRWGRAAGSTYAPPLNADRRKCITR